jgi:hypothetical protein
MAEVNNYFNKERALRVLYRKLYAVSYQHAPAVGMEHFAIY